MLEMLYLVERGFQDILREFGQIDILVNSSGILNENDVEKCLKVNSVNDFRNKINIANVCNDMIW